VRKGYHLRRYTSLHAAKQRDKMTGSNGAMGTAMRCVRPLECLYRGCSDWTLHSAW